MGLGECSLKRLPPSHILQYGTAIIYSLIQFYHQIFQNLFSNHILSLIIFNSLYCLLRSRWRVHKTWTPTSLSSSQCCLPWNNSSLVVMCSLTSLMHYTLLLPLASVGSKKMFGYVLGQFARLVKMCVIAPAHNTWRYRLYQHDAHCYSKRIIKTHPWVVHMQHLSCVNIINSLVDRVLSIKFLMVLCTFRRWHYCSSVHWSVFRILFLRTLISLPVHRL